MCEVVGGQQADRKFGFQANKTIQCPELKAITDLEIRSDNTDVVNTYQNLPDYFRSRRDRGAGKRACWVLNARNSQ